MANLQMFKLTFTVDQLLPELITFLVDSTQDRDFQVSEIQYVGGILKVILSGLARHTVLNYFPTEVESAEESWDALQEKLEETGACVNILGGEADPAYGRITQISGDIDNSKLHIGEDGTCEYTFHNMLEQGFDCIEIVDIDPGLARVDEFKKVNQPDPDGTYTMEQFLSWHAGQANV